jgi:putative transcriptional regulator
MLNLKPKNSVKPKKGSLLLAEPFLADPYFKRSVVFLCEHNDEGSFGFVLNRFLDEYAFEDLVKGETFKGQPVCLGGPVQNESLFYLHNYGEKVVGSVKVTKDIWFGGDFESLKEVYKSLPPNSHYKVRFFVGYSGWSPNQLSEELKEDSWLICNQYDSSDILSKDFDTLWSKLVRGFGDKYSIWLNAPSDPILN